ncbi:uncharacterized protein Tco025E_07711 [Trypanosoma conorhini]|uniref:DUF1935 domain-containing protein n=1 Tax=Trypanosoma conorhini TaxID=83891 RepID=A0A422NJY0_9TRYP|nr:uncharacterized protein Tco025E_07711 [Trypanosoma conorhini]RNF05818.1 hypothetical protein Tco025E_07711 [Trypanosoma conorhini]
MTDLVTDTSGLFEHGTPGFAFNNVYRCFPQSGNGLLFRLVNDKKQWAFYNDTERMVFRVSAKLGKGSRVKALGRAKLTELSEEEKGQWGFEVSVLVEPGRTERFLEGSVEGFQVDFQSEAVSEDDVEFENGRPAVKYDSVYRCLKGHGNGLLFRLVTKGSGGEECTWSYYNDTKDYVMEVEVAFADKSCVEPLGKTRVEVDPANKEGVVYKTSVWPLRTESFLRGHPREYRQNFLANPMDNEQSEDFADIHFENGRPDPDVIAYPCSKIFRGFKNKGNGLVFLLVDDEAKKWAFYNDTTEYSITVTVKFAPKSVYRAARNTAVSKNPDVEGGTICVVTVPPVTTELFITDGNPAEYQMSFSAVGAERSQPEEHPKYENGGPDKSVMPLIDKVYKCFKDHGNGLLFRLVDERRGQWGFYNDTKDVTFSVKVNFEHDSSVNVLGKTRREEDAELGPVCVLDVPPRSTELFAKGDLSGFSTKFSGKRHA